MGTIGTYLWKLSQLGLVVLLVVFGALMMMGPEEAEEEVVRETPERESGKREGVVARIKALLGGGKTDQNGTTDPDQDRSELAISQRDLAEGHIDLEKLLDLKDANKEVTLLAEGTTQVQQLVFWQIVGGDIYYRIVLTPYDRPAHKLMMNPAEALFMSFLTAGGERVVPVSGAERIPTKDLREATKEGYAVGWFSDGKLSLEGRDPNQVERGEVGWIFSSGLHARLKTVQRLRGTDGKPVTDPYGINIPVQGG